MCFSRDSNAEVTLDTKLSKHVCQPKLVFTTQRFQAWSTASSPFRCVEAITTARVQAQHGPDKASGLSIILARYWASKSCSPSRANHCLLCSLLLLLAPCSKNSPFLQHSMLSRSELTLQISNCGSQSVPPNLVRHAALGQIRIHMACSLARQLAKCFAASAESNLSWANQFAPCCVNLVQNQTPSSV